MPLILMVGMNGAGKDTITKHIMASNDNVVLLSGAQIMMRGLGIDVDIEVGFPPKTTREMYQKLEQASELQKKNIRDTVFRDTLLGFARSNCVGVLLSQLVVPVLRQDGDFDYQPQVTAWYPDAFDGFVYVRAPIEQIAKRREDDLKSGSRDRGNMSLQHLEEHKVEYEKAWTALSGMDGVSRLMTIENTDGNLAQSVVAVKHFLSQIVEIKGL